MRLLRTIVFAVPLAALGASADATTMSETQRVCPVGGETYASFQIGSTSQFGTRLDLRPIGPAANLPRVECPNGFIVFKAEDSFTPQEIEVLSALVADASFQEARTAHVPAYRLYLQHRALGAGEDALAFALLNAAWEAEDGYKPELHPTYLRDALAGFERWGGVAAADSDDWWTAGLLAAEIKRQLGDFAGAIAAIDALPTGERPSDEIIRLAAEQIRALAAQQDAAPAEIKPPANP